MIERLLCDLHLSGTSLARDLDMPVAVLDLYLDQIATGLSEMLQRDEHGIAIKPEARPFARMIASRLDRYALPAI
jgi:oxygen-independent coproporphyrinogen-3 oxidase